MNLRYEQKGIGKNITHHAISASTPVLIPESPKPFKNIVVLGVNMHTQNNPWNSETYFSTLSDPLSGSADRPRDMVDTAMIPKPMMPIF